MSKHIELGKKLKVMMERAGTAAEKSSAEKLLNDLLLKHHISIEDLEDEKLQDYYFDINDENHNLWYQVVKSISTDIKCYGKFPAHLINDLALKGNYMITCTLAQYVEAEAKYDFYLKLYTDELDIFFTAFCKANNLLVENKNTDEKPLTDEEKQKWIRIFSMADKVKNSQFHKQLNR